ncbi:unnamed protein product [Ostreobium quekettii]|uniref:Peptidase S1 domain-containing protein n=1 Tax=Ostreobium quekettii TaxID=121088 RepID=A0A8S1JFU9_9CHLO|nr:unnamed protein product [Ostreobium quekettii]|eukprot:evm.model.scf_489.4 EVM.evm.TU.scf_489.4   scf_489:39318-46868(+)
MAGGRLVSLLPALSTLITAIALLARGGGLPGSAPPGSPVAPTDPPDEVEVRGKIMAGVPAPAGRHPYVVSIRNAAGKHSCGGTLIKKDVILTAAHCVSELSQPPIVHVYTDDDETMKGVAQEIRARRMFVHEKWLNGHFKDGFDIALLLLPWEFDIPLPQLAKAGSDFPRNRPLVALGWGEVSKNHMANELQMADNLTVHDNSMCGFKTLSKGVICAESMLQNTCQGDSGGPLLLSDTRDRSAKTDIIVGVTSSGPECFEKKNQIGLYTRVDVAREWIDNSVVALKQEGKSAHDPRDLNIPKGRISYVASIKSLSTQGHLCSGVLIDTRHVITAAHCVDPKSDWSAGMRPIITLGETHVSGKSKSGMEVQAEETIIHEQWLPDRRTDSPYNIALMRLPREAPQSPPVVMYNDYKLKTGQEVVAVGWGAPRILLGDEIFSGLNSEKQTFLDGAACNRSSLWDGSVEVGQVCAINEELTASCVVDSGAPIVLLYRHDKPVASQNFDHVIGINAGGASCGTANKPDKYIDLRFHKDWIDGHTKRARECSPCVAGHCEL